MSQQHSFRVQFFTTKTLNPKNDGLIKKYNDSAQNKALNFLRESGVEFSTTDPFGIQVTNSTFAGCLEEKEKLSEILNKHFLTFKKNNGQNLRNCWKTTCSHVNKTDIGSPDCTKGKKRQGLANEINETGRKRYLSSTTSWASDSDNWSLLSKPPTPRPRDESPDSKASEPIDFVYTERATQTTSETKDASSQTEACGRNSSTQTLPETCEDPQLDQNQESEVIITYKRKASMGVFLHTFSSKGRGIKKLEINYKSTKSTVSSKITFVSRELADLYLESLITHDYKYWDFKATDFKIKKSHQKT